MKKSWLTGLLVTALFLGYHIAAQEHDAKRGLLTLALENAQGEIAPR
ncbi:MAG: hypothetical protein WAK48_13470 [Candidatus Acidiferrum sp.]|jgi:hypothetical protein